MEKVTNCSTRFDLSCSNGCCQVGNRDFTLSCQKMPLINFSIFSHFHRTYLGHSPFMNFSGSGTIIKWSKFQDIELILLISVMFSVHLFLFFFVKNLINLSISLLLLSCFKSIIYSLHFLIPLFIQFF